MASGFSQNTCRPAATALASWRGCSLVHVQMYTASHPAITSSSEPQTVCPLDAANAAARSTSGSNTPARSTSAPLRRRLFEWYVAINPAPRNPTRTDPSATPADGTRDPPVHRSATFVSCR